MTEHTLLVPDNINYLSDWNDLDLLLPRGKVILNKSICGCGCTEAYLTNSKPVILISPRRELINCKMNKSGRTRPLYYFDRSKKSVDVQTTISQMDLNLSNPMPEFIPKILSTYDSAKIVLDHLAQRGLLDGFTIVVDEFPCIFTDAKLKGDVELTMIRHLSRLSNDIVFVSATPIKDIYLDATPEFCNVPVYTLIWPPSKIREIGLDRQVMRSTREACGKVIEEYRTNGFFKSTIIDGNHVFSTEALFFLNSVSDIEAIIRKYKLTPDETVIICAEDNESKLAKIGFKIGHASSEQTYKTDNKPFTFITKASFEGTDFYSDNASTYVFADPGVKSLSLDISIDLPQIAGRIRTDSNPFRNVITYFYKTSLNRDIQKLEADIDNRIHETELFLSKYENTNDLSLLQKIRDAQKVQKYKTDYIDVIQTVDDTGMPIWSMEGNIYAKLADLRGIEILKGQYNTNYSVFVSVTNSGFNTTNPLGGTNGDKLNAFYLNFISDNNFVRKMKLYADFLDNEPTLKAEVEAIPQVPMEYKTYYNSLSSDRLKALGYREKEIKAEIYNNQSYARIQSALASILTAGNAYTLSDLKIIIQQVYDDLKILRTAKGTDVEKYFPSVKEVKIIIPDGKRKKGYRL